MQELVRRLLEACEEHDIELRGVRVNQKNEEGLERNPGDPEKRRA